MAILADRGDETVERILADLEDAEDVVDVDIVFSDDRPVYVRVTIAARSPASVNRVRYTHGLKWGAPAIDEEGRLVVALGVPNDGEEDDP